MRARAIRKYSEQIKPCQDPNSIRIRLRRWAARAALAIGAIEPCLLGAEGVARLAASRENWDALAPLVETILPVR